MTSDQPHRLDVAIGRRIRERRRAIGLSQADLAAAIGVTFQQVQKYERGANRVSFSRLMEIVRALRCNLSDLTDDLEVEPRAESAAQIEGLLETEGAVGLLEAYAALPNVALRRALLKHARTLVGALGPGET